MGNCIRSLSLHQIQHLSTPTLWETPHYPCVGGSGIPLSTPLLWETYAVVNGPTMTRLPFSTPVLREICVFRCEVCYNVVSFTPPRELCPVIPMVFREVFEFLSTPFYGEQHRYQDPLRHFQHPFHGKPSSLSSVTAKILLLFNTLFAGNRAQLPNFLRLQHLLPSHLFRTRISLCCI
jgi:hypothetical protein